MRTIDLSPGGNLAVVTYAEEEIIQESFQIINDYVASKSQKPLPFGHWAYTGIERFDTFNKHILSRLDQNKITELNFNLQIGLGNLYLKQHQELYDALRRLWDEPGRSDEAKKRQDADLVCARGKLKQTITAIISAWDMQGTVHMWTAHAIRPGSHDERFEKELYREILLMWKSSRDKLGDDVVAVAWLDRWLGAFNGFYNQEWCWVQNTLCWKMLHDLGDSSQAYPPFQDWQQEINRFRFKHRLNFDIPATIGGIKERLSQFRIMIKYPKEHDSWSPENVHNHHKVDMFRTLSSQLADLEIRQRLQDDPTSLKQFSELDRIALAQFIKDANAMVKASDNSLADVKAMIANWHASFLLFLTYDLICMGYAWNYIRFIADMDIDSFIINFEDGNLTRPGWGCRVAMFQVGIFQDDLKTFMRRRSESLRRRNRKIALKGRSEAGRPNFKSRDDAQTNDRGAGPQTPSQVLHGISQRPPNNNSESQEGLSSQSQIMRGMKKTNLDNQSEVSKSACIKRVLNLAGGGSGFEKLADADPDPFLQAVEGLREMAKRHAELEPTIISSVIPTASRKWKSSLDWGDEMESADEAPDTSMSGDVTSEAQLNSWILKPYRDENCKLSEDTETSTKDSKDGNVNKPEQSIPVEISRTTLPAPPQITPSFSEALTGKHKQVVPSAWDEDSMQKQIDSKEADTSSVCSTSSEDIVPAKEDLNIPIGKIIPSQGPWVEVSKKKKSKTMVEDNKKDKISQQQWRPETAYIKKVLRAESQLKCREANPLARGAGTPEIPEVVKRHEAVNDPPTPGASAVAATKSPSRAPPGSVGGDGAHRDVDQQHGRSELVRAMRVVDQHPDQEKRQENLAYSQADSEVWGGGAQTSDPPPYNPPPSNAPPYTPSGARDPMLSKAASKSRPRVEDDGRAGNKKILRGASTYSTAPIPPTNRRNKSEDAAHDDIPPIAVSRNLPQPVDAITDRRVGVDRDDEDGGEVTITTKLLPDMAAQEPPMRPDMMFLQKYFNIKTPANTAEPRVPAMMKTKDKDIDPRSPAAGESCVAKHKPSLMAYQDKAESEPTIADEAGIDGGYNINKRPRSAGNPPQLRVGDDIWLDMSGSQKCDTLSPAALQFYVALTNRSKSAPSGADRFILSGRNPHSTMGSTGNGSLIGLSPDRTSPQLAKPAQTWQVESLTHCTPPSREQGRCRPRRASGTPPRHRKRRHPHPRRASGTPPRHTFRIAYSGEAKPSVAPGPPPPPTHSTIYNPPQNTPTKRVHILNPTAPIYHFTANGPIPPREFIQDGYSRSGLAPRREQDRMRGGYHVGQHYPVPMRISRPPIAARSDFGEAPYPPLSESRLPHQSYGTQSYPIHPPNAGRLNPSLAQPYHLREPYQALNVVWHEYRPGEPFPGTQQYQIHPATPAQDPHPPIKPLYLSSYGWYCQQATFQESPCPVPVPELESPYPISDQDPGSPNLFAESTTEVHQLVPGPECTVPADKTPVPPARLRPSRVFVGRKPQDINTIISDGHNQGLCAPLLEDLQRMHDRNRAGGSNPIRAGKRTEDTIAIDEEDKFVGYTTLMPGMESVVCGLLEQWYGKDILDESL